MLTSKALIVTTVGSNELEKLKSTDFCNTNSTADPTEALRVLFSSTTPAWVKSGLILAPEPVAATVNEISNSTSEALDTFGL